MLTPNVPTGSDPSPVGRYREPSVLPDGRIIVSWAGGPVNDMNEQSLTPPDFGIYIYDPASGQNQLVYNDRTTWDLNAIAVAPRTEPPVIGNSQHQQDSTIPIRIGSVNIAQTSLNEVVSGAQFDNVPLGQALQQGAVAVRVIEGFSSESAKGVTMFGLTMFEGAAVLGEAPVFADGSWLVNAPPYIPMHMQPIDKFGLAIRSQQLWMQGMPGEDRRCVGCHESRTGQGVPTFGANPTVAEQHGAADFTEAIADRTEYPWNTKVQAILDAKCGSCHNPSTTSYYYMTRTDPVSGTVTTYKIPSLDLSSTPITVYYDRKVATYPASYVSIFYPATLGMMDSGDTGKIVVTGAAPCQQGGLTNLTPAGCTPWYGIPGSARASALTQKINLHGILNGVADGSTAWDINANPLHPEDQGHHVVRRGSQDHRGLSDGPRWPVLGAPEHRVRADDQRRPSHPRVELKDEEEKRHASQQHSQARHGLLPRGGRVLRGDRRPQPDGAASGDAQRSGILGGVRIRAADQAEFLSSPDAIKSAAASGAPTLVWETLEHGEKVECLDCIALVSPLLYDANAKTREIAAWWLRRRIFGVFGQGEVYQQTLQTLQTDGDAVRRSYAAYALGEFFAAPGIDAVASALVTDGDARVRGRLGQRAGATERRRRRRARRGARRRRPDGATRRPRVGGTDQHLLVHVGAGLAHHRHERRCTTPRRRGSRRAERDRRGRTGACRGGARCRSPRARHRLPRPGHLRQLQRALRAAESGRERPGRFRPRPGDDRAAKVVVGRLPWGPCEPRASL